MFRSGAGIGRVNILAALIREGPLVAITVLCVVVRGGEIFTKAATEVQLPLGSHGVTTTILIRESNITAFAWLAGGNEPLSGLNLQILARPATIPRARVAETGQKRFPKEG